jgi:thymidylate synthase (FAD)
MVGSNSGIGPTDSNQDIVIRDRMTVDLIDIMGSDYSICHAARVSTTAGNSSLTKDDGCNGLIRYLMRNRHGTPFEHAALTFLIEAPIFVTRQLLKHRAGVSINEESGRYHDFRPIFYVPLNSSRPLGQSGRPADYDYLPGTDDQRGLINTRVRQLLADSWMVYTELRSAGISKEVARMNLPLCTFSTIYITLNPRSLMHLLSLRTLNNQAQYVSHPQWETDQVAKGMEETLGAKFPHTYAAFNEFGRVAP